MHHGKILRMAIDTQTPVLLWGPPGCGKTSTVHAIAEALDAHIEGVIASIREPADFGGWPVVWKDDKNPTVIRVPDDWARALMDAKNHYKIAFFDEMTTAPPAVQAALLRVILEGRVGSHVMAGVAMIGAANPPEMAAGGWDLTPPLANRFGHIGFELDSDAWVTGMTAGFTAPDISGNFAQWPTFLPAAKAEVASFIHHRPGLLLEMPKDETAQGRAWPSPRTWDMFAKMRAAQKASGSDEGLGQLATAFVGDGAAKEFYTWHEQMDLPDPEMLLADPKSWAKPARPDIAFAALSAMTAQVMANPTPDRWLAAWEVLFICADRDGMPDVAAVSAKALVSRPIPNTVIPQQAFKVFGPMLTAAGKLKV